MFLLLLICGREVHIFSHACSFVCMLSRFLRLCWLFCKNRSPDKAFLNTSILFGSVFSPRPLFFCYFGTSSCPRACRREEHRFLLMAAIMFSPLESKLQNGLTQDLSLCCPRKSLSGRWKHQGKSKQDLRPPFWQTNP